MSRQRWFVSREKGPKGETLGAWKYFVDEFGDFTQIERLESEKVIVKDGNNRKEHKEERIFSKQYY